MDRTQPQSVLVADDEPATARFLLEVLARRGIHAKAVFDGREALEQLDSRPWDMVMTDLKMPGADGLSVLRRAKEHAPEMPVVMITAYGSVDSAVEAMRSGCTDFLVKPVTTRQVDAVLESVFPNHPVPEADVAGRVWKIIGSSDSLRAACQLARRVAPTTTSVLIEGESGTGKELIAQLIHSASARARGTFIQVNCAAVSESLLESELFGHERGAFTGAYARRLGRFERAHCGTLLLDEITETTPRLQAELLRVLEQQDFERLGGSETVHVDVRLVTTTNRDIRREIAEGRFRRDLYYRINGLTIRIPPLRERPEDIPALVWHFVNLHAREVRRPITKIDPRAMEQLVAYGWPGNVRQLRSLVRAALILGEGPVLKLGDAGHHMEDDGLDREVSARGQTLKDAERTLILNTLNEAKRSQVEAARILGISARTLRSKLARYRAEGLLD